MTVHKTGFRIYYEDTDAGGIVYHARYLALAERARTEALRMAGTSVASLLAETGLAFVVTRLEIAYQAPLRLDDWVEIATDLLSIGQARCQLRQTLSCGDMQAAILTVELACITQDSGRPARIPPRWRASLQAMSNRS
ncbi:YbgC/FadM family acyl-CoA thioesterase [Swaminathania salitolerans]|uniref:4-hydroxybenzoyl-CoA thioesterase n=1 Tax=Swaminathania salitolerans TaxID=182838 RepID=A0A511BMS8_9PROT|nr:YbgC/FadM family acyl-CoA thioesterase [Swaminathania salitolerans]GBQ15461.1 4-hydroxybenzoyl-CoA thioesterase [Swaminathania salitolerans LMG 21291]GEL01362.1 4-hydroxybenzoyl-CoA thioesterase [Swaminathania salitolerans]